MTAPTKTRPRRGRKPYPPRPRKPKTATKAATPARRPTNISDRALREAFATLNREPRTIPASWWDESTAENMAEWIKRTGALRLARKFGRGK